MRLFHYLVLLPLLLLPATLLAADGDGDGIDDDWELRYGMDPGNPADASEDRDYDGLDALAEFINGTRPWLADTDGDWVGDGFEVNTLGTNPLDADSDDDQIVDGLEGFYGFDPLDPASGPGDQDGDGFDTIEETRLGSNPTNTAQTPAYQGNFSESFEALNLGLRWFTPPESDVDWRRRCDVGQSSDGLCSRRAGELYSGAGVSKLGLQLYVRAGKLSFKPAYSTSGLLQVWVDGIRIYERAGWSIWAPVELYFPEGLHDIVFVHQNEGNGGGILAIDEVEYTEVTGIYGADASNRFCADVQRFLANTNVTTYNKIEPDFDAFLVSKVEPWPEQDPYPGNDEPLTLHQLITKDPTDSYEQLISCKVKHYEGLNVTVQGGLGAAPQRDCFEINQQTLDNVVANLTPAELALVPTDGQGELILPVLDADQGSFASEWVYDTAYVGLDGLTHVQAKRLKLPFSAPPGFEPPPERRGVHYCHLIAPEYMKVLVLGGSPVDNAPAGRD